MKSVSATARINFGWMPVNLWSRGGAVGEAIGEVDTESNTNSREKLIRDVLAHGASSPADRFSRVFFVDRNRVAQFPKQPVNEHLPSGARYSVPTAWVENINFRLEIKPSSLK